LTAVSGIRVHYDRTKPQGAQVISLMLLDGTPVDDSKLYSVTTNDFVVAGGDGFTEFAKGTDIVDSGIFLRDVLVNYIKAKRDIAPILDGRVAFD
jgi:2',3'-cyclic-nucleotide 2'-phosphodiesterase (5'-nucleotidase family)